MIGPITHTIDVKRYVSMRLASAASHKTQSFLIKRLDELMLMAEGRQMMATEYLALVVERTDALPSPSAQSGAVWRSLIT
jgi:hypothetical protein